MGVEGVEGGEDGPLADVLGDDGVGDALAGHVGEFQVQQLRWAGVALAHQMRGQPVQHDGLELAEEVQLGRLVGRAPLGLHQPLRQVVGDGVVAVGVQALQREVHAFADDAFVAGDRRADEGRGERQR